MRHGSIRRVATGTFLLPAFLLFGAGDAFSVHVCPHHGIEGGPAGGHELHEPGGGVEADPSHAHPTPVPEADPSDRADHEGPCTCPGACHAGEPVSASVYASSAEVPLRAPLTLLSERTFDVRPPRTALPYVLPLSTAPPTG